MYVTNLKKVTFSWKHFPFLLVRGKWLVFLTYFFFSSSFLWSFLDFPY